MSTTPIYNKKQIAYSFGRASSTYDKAAFLQRATGQYLLKKLIKLKNFKQIPEIILDLGSGSGQLTYQLAQQFTNSTINSIDIAIGMLRFSQVNYLKNNIQLICADVEQLPFQNNSCDLVFSNLMLQWSPDYQQSLKEIWRVLKPNGILLFSTLGPNTLQELRYCWKKVDHYPHVHSFIPLKTLIQALTQNRFFPIRSETKNYYRYFSKVLDLMKELKLLGASNIQNERSKTLMSKKKLQDVCEFYEKFRNKENMLLSTYQVYFILTKKMLK